MAKILIKNGRVWDGERFFFADVLTDGERILKIKPNILEKAEYTYNANSNIVSAGLVDLHAHLRVVADDPYGIPAETGCFPFGVTAAADAGRIKGERATVDSFMVKNLIFVNAPIHNNRVDWETMENAIAKFGNKTVGIKVYFDTNVSEVSDITPLKQICHFAKTNGLRVMVHCSHSPTTMTEILNVLNTGDILTHAFHGGINNAAEDDFLSIKEAQMRGVIIDAGFAGHVHTDFGILSKAIEREIMPNTISTDITKLSAYTRGGRYGMTMCMSIAKYMGMKEEDIFKAVTSTPATVLGKAGEWGILAAGKKADVAVFEYADDGFSLTDRAGNHIENALGYRCVLTMADGQIVYKH